MLICRNAKGVRGQRKVGNPCSNKSPYNISNSCLDVVTLRSMRLNEHFVSAP